MEQWDTLGAVVGGMRGGVEVGVPAQTVGGVMGGAVGDWKQGVGGCLGEGWKGPKGPA